MKFDLTATAGEISRVVGIVGVAMRAEHDGEAILGDARVVFFVGGGEAADGCGRWPVDPSAASAPIAVSAAGASDANRGNGG
jgi:hypothetical protein